MAGSGGSAELGAFLRAHRNALQPGDVGMPEVGRRRTPGLRREEVATLAGVGVAWYSWLEQGRVSASLDILEALSRALRLDDHAQRHARVLAGFYPIDDDEPEIGSTVRVHLERSVDALAPSPAVLVDHRFDVLHANDSFALLWPGVRGEADEVRNLLPALLSAAASHPRDDEKAFAIALLQQFRVNVDRNPRDPRFTEITEQLRRETPTWDRHLSCHSVHEFTAQDLLVQRDELEEFMALSFSILRPVGSRGAMIFVGHATRPEDHASLIRLIAAADPVPVS